MHVTTEEYVKKAILDTQERVRDFMKYSHSTENKKLSQFLKEFAEVEAKHVTKLEEFIH